MEVMKSRKEKPRVEVIFYLLVFALALFVRIYKLGDLPYGLHIDEAGMGYDAWSLSQWGLDRYYKFYPVYFINYGGGQSVLYGYLCAFLLKFLGLSTTVLRIPAVVFGMLTWLFGTLLIRENLGKKEGMAGSLLLAVCPCFIIMSRMALDCFLFSGSAAVSLYCFTKAIKAGTGRRALCLYGVTGISFGVTLYTYALSWLVVPLFLVFAISYLLYLHKISWKQLVCMGIPLALLAAPLMLMLAINTFELPEIATIHFTIPRLLEYRGAEVSLKNVINNIPLFVQSLFFYDDWRYNSVPTWFSMYLVSVPFVLIGAGEGIRGLCRSVRERKISFTAVIFFWFTAQICMGLCIKDPNVNKMNGIYFSMVFLTILGFNKCWKGLISLKGKRVFLFGTAGLYLVFSLSFIGYYFTKYTEDTHPLPLFAETYAEVLEDWKDVIGDRQVYTDMMYIYYALGEKQSPMEFQLIEQGMSDRGNVHFGFPDRVDEDGFYITFDGGSLTEQLEKDGFQSIQTGKLTVLYK